MIIGTAAMLAACPWQLIIVRSDIIIHLSEFGVHKVMKKKLLFVVSTFVVLGLAIAVFAFNNTGVSTAPAACCKGDSCPMKGKHAETKDPSSMHENCACKDGKESCPMMKDGAMAGHQMKMDGTPADHQKMMDGKESCPMMKDGAMAGHQMKMDSLPADHQKMMDGKESCPMMKGGAMKDHKMNADAAKTSGGKDGCGCCSKKMDGKTAPAI